MSRFATPVAVVTLLLAAAPVRTQDMALSQVLAAGETWRAVAPTPEAKALLGDRNVVKTPNGTVFRMIPSERAIYAEKGDKREKVVSDFPVASLVLWPDGGTLVCGDAESKYLWTYRIDADGGLSAKEKYYTLQTRRGQKTVGTGGLTVDSAGRLYAATDLGIQVLDPTGRLSGVMAGPAGQKVVDIAFGGSNRDELYASTEAGVFVRKLKAKGPAKP
jgi:enterochelin esterase family protein